MNSATNPLGTAIHAVLSPQSTAASLKSRFDLLHARRFQKMRMAYDCAKLTLPTLLPENPDNMQTYRNLQKNNESIGARAVNNIASKLLLALFPTNTLFYKFSADEIIVQQLSELDAMQQRESAQAGIKATVDEKLSLLEEVIRNLIERQVPRAKLFEVLKLLVVTGDALVVKLPKKKMKMHNLNNYVVTRDGEGDVTEIIVKETVGYATLSQELQNLLAAPVMLMSKQPDPLNSVLELYTVIEQENENRYRTWQEIAGITVPGSKGSYTKENLPYLALRWNEVLNEDYGRSMVEDYIGDLRALENDALTMDKITRACGKIIPMVSPNGLTKVSDLNRAKDGEFIYGKQEDVSFFTVEKLNDMNVVHSHAQEIKMDIKASFLMNSVVQRNGERVTAEEIRTVAAELEENLGGVYSVLSQDFQLPLVKLMYEEAKSEFKRLGVSKDLELGKDLKLVITTGLDAIGRGNDANKLRTFIGTLKEAGGDLFLSWLNPPDIIKRYAASLSVDSKGLVKTPEQKAQEEQQARQQMMGQTLIGEASKAAPDLVKGYIGGQNETQQ